MVEIKRVSTGIFEVFKENEKTNWQIVNGCMGSSGRGANIYALYNTESGKTIVVGSLFAAKKNIRYFLEKKKS